MSDLVLGDSLEVLIDNRGKNPPFVESGVPAISGMHVRPGWLILEEARFVSEETYAQWMPVKVRRHDVVMTSEAPLGRVALIQSDEPLVLAQRVYGLRGKAGVLDSRFLYYALQTETVQAALLSRATGTTVQGIRQSELMKVKIPAPSFRRQQAIAAILGAIDDKIAINDRTALASHGLAQAHTTLALEGASITSLSEVAEITMGSSPPGETYNKISLGMPFYQGSRDFGMRFPAPRTWCTKPVRVASAGAVLVSVRAPVGSLNVAAEECCIGRGLAALVSKTKTSSSLFHVLSRATAVWTPFESEGTVFGSINKKQLEVLRIPMLNENSIQRLEELLDPLDRLVMMMKKQNALLVELRDAILPKLMSGEIKVRDAEKVVEDAL